MAVAVLCTGKSMHVKCAVEFYVRQQGGGARWNPPLTLGNPPPALGDVCPRLTGLLLLSPARPAYALSPVLTEDAEAWKAKGEAVILCRQETSPEDVGGMHAAEGILTSRGGMTSHAAVVARGWGKPCCCGCEELIVDAFAKTLKAPVSSNRGDRVGWLSFGSQVTCVYATLANDANDAAALRVVTNTASGWCCVLQCYLWAGFCVGL